MIAHACNWTVDQAGRTVCATRRELHRAVVEITKLRGGAARTAAFEEANRAFAAHHCTPAPEMQARPVGGGAVHAVAAVAPAGPVTHLDLHRALLECTGAALVLGMRIEREAHPDAPADLEEKIREAEKRMEAASEALLRALERYGRYGHENETRRTVGDGDAPGSL